MKIGPIPEGYDVDHVCQVIACVRPHPDHLEAVTPLENQRRRRLPYCGHGHAFTTENTYTWPDGRRECRTCRAERRRAA